MESDSKDIYNVQLNDLYLSHNLENKNVSRFPKNIGQYNCFQHW